MFAGRYLSQSHESPANAFLAWMDVEGNSSLQMVGETKVSGDTTVTLMEIITLPDGNSIYLHFFVQGKPGQVMGLSQVKLDGAKDGWISMGDPDTGPGGIGDRGIMDMWQQVELPPGSAMPDNLTATVTITKFNDIGGPAEPESLGELSFDVPLKPDYKSMDFQPG